MGFTLTISEKSNTVKWNKNYLFNNRICKPPFYHEYCISLNGFHFDNSKLLTGQIFLMIRLMVLQRWMHEYCKLLTSSILKADIKIIVIGGTKSTKTRRRRSSIKRWRCKKNQYYELAESMQHTVIFKYPQNLSNIKLQANNSMPGSSYLRIIHAKWYIM